MNSAEIQQFANAAQFKKSRLSEGVGNCVEVAFVEAVAVRDSKDPDGPVLWFTVDEWSAFIDGARAGEFDLM